MKTCTRCKLEHPIELFSLRKNRPDGQRRSQCRPCAAIYTADKKREQRMANPRPPRAGMEIKGKKLPDYATLKRLFVDERMSYLQIAQRYDCTTRSVQQTLRNRAMAKGEWPLITPEETSRRTVESNLNKGKLPPYEVLVGLMLNDKMSYAEIGRVYGVGFHAVLVKIRTQAKLRGQWPLRTPEQQRARWRCATDTVAADIIMEMVFEQAESAATKEIELGVIGAGTVEPMAINASMALTHRELGREIGVSPTIFSSFKSGRRTRMKKATAVKMLEWLGEEVPATLLKELPEGACGCGETLTQPARGRRIKYCSDECYTRFTGKPRKSRLAQTREDEAA